MNIREGADDAGAYTKEEKALDIEDYVDDYDLVFGRHPYPNKKDMSWLLPLPMNATEQYVFGKRNRTCYGSEKGKSCDNKDAWISGTVCP